MKYLKQFELYSGYLESYDKIKMELSKYKSINFSEDKIEFIFNELSIESSGKCYYQYNMDKMTNLFHNYFVSFYVHAGSNNWLYNQFKDGDLVTTDRATWMVYYNSSLKTSINRGIGDIMIEWYDSEIYRTLNAYIDKFKPFTVYIDKTIMMKDAGRYNL